MHSLKDFSSSAHPVTEYPDDAQHPSTEDIIPTHGFVSALLARRTRSLGKGGRRGAVVIVRGGIFFRSEFRRRFFFSFFFWRSCDGFGVWSRLEVEVREGVWVGGQLN